MVAIEWIQKVGFVCCQIYIGIQWLVGGAIAILKNDGVRQWEGWHPIYEMENKKGLKPPTRCSFEPFALFGNADSKWDLKCWWNGFSWISSYCWLLKLLNQFEISTRSAQVTLLTSTSLPNVQWRTIFFFREEEEEHLETHLTNH